MSDEDYMELQRMLSACKTPDEVDKLRDATIKVMGEKYVRESGLGEQFAMVANIISGP